MKSDRKPVGVLSNFSAAIAACWVTALDVADDITYTSVLVRQFDLNVFSTQHNVARRKQRVAAIETCQVSRVKDVLPVKFQLNWKPSTV